MYKKGHEDNKFNVEHYGHPSEFGYKEFIDLFNPTKLDYDKLVEKYKAAGAKYAVILGVFHDNFDLWDSKHHEWNSVKKSPHRDLVAEFRDAARKHDLPLGITTHLGRSYSWFQSSHGADETGDKAGVPYDGANPEYQSLYHPPFENWPRYPKNPPESWQLEWYLRVKDLVDSYKPDLLYFDGGYPYDDGAVGRRLVAHYYNSNSKWNNGQNKAAMCIKKLPGDFGGFHEGTCIEDIERGRIDKMTADSWQTDTCIGQWFYREDVEYKTVPEVVHTLIDIVSKNGNLLLNIPIHPDGSIDAREEAFLDGIGKWMKVNGEGIYGTRPWLKFGEGPTEYTGGHFKEDKQDYTPQDIRFTCKGDRVLYAYFLAWPDDGRITIASLSPRFAPKLKIKSVKMLGKSKSLNFEQTGDGLIVTLPKRKPCDHAWAICIEGEGLNEIVAAAPENARAEAGGE